MPVDEDSTEGDKKAGREKPEVGSVRHEGSSSVEGRDMVFIHSQTEQGDYRVIRQRDERVP